MGQRTADDAARCTPPAAKSTAPVQACGATSSCGCGAAYDWRAVQRLAGNSAMADAVEAGSDRGAGNALLDSVSAELARAGEPLEPETLAAMEDSIGRDLRDVRVHSGSSAAKAAQDLGALAFTAGRHIVFGAGRYQPSSPEGQRLLSHELVHVAQQADGRTHMLDGAGGDPVARESLEREAGGAGVPAPRPEPAPDQPALDRPRPRGLGLQAASRAARSVAQAASARVVQMAAGPMTCMRMLTLPGGSDMATGNAVEAAILTHFRSRVGRPHAIGDIPGASSAPYRTDGRGNIIDSQTIGGLLQGDGKPDLAYRRRGSKVMLLAEIKPASVGGIGLGIDQVANYIDKGNSYDNEAWRRALGVSVFAPMLPTLYRPPRFVRVGTRRFHVAWCGPGLIVYKEEQKKKKKGAPVVLVGDVTG